VLMGTLNPTHSLTADDFPSVLWFGDSKGIRTCHYDFG